MVRDRKYRVALVGAGNIAASHAEALARLPEVEVASVCDQNLRRAEGFAKQHGIPHACAGLAEMLETDTLDVVHVLVPPHRHFHVASAALDAGVSVFLEKPMCISTGECETLIETANRSQCVIGVDHNYLFSDIYERLRADLVQGRLGPIEQMTITRDVEFERLRSGPFDAWMFRDPANIIFEMGPHAIGQILDLVGCPEEVGVKAFDPVELPGHRRFYRRWYINAFRGSSSIQLRYSFNLGFAEDTIRVRGALAGATMDIMRNAYLLHHHTRYGIDFDRYLMARSEARSLGQQARRTLARYILSTLRLSKAPKNPYVASIAKAVEAFYAGMAGSLDRRISAQFGLEVVRLCERLAQLGNVANPKRSPPARLETVSGPSPDVLVLGGTGFIGKHLVRKLLNDGRPVTLLTRNPGLVPEEFLRMGAKLRQGDITNPTDVRDAVDGAKYVYHLARAIVKTWDDYYHQDVLPTKTVAEACLEYGVKRLIYTGTIASYYTGRKAGTITEDTPLDPHIRSRQHYARAKAMAEEILMKMHDHDGLPVVIFRPGIVLGTGGSPFHWGIGMWSWTSICQLWGDGTNTLPIVMVKDVAEALAAALHVDGIDGESFNLVAEPCLTRLEYLEEFERCAGICLRKLPTPIWRFYLNDMLKWVVKCAVGHRDRRMPSYRDWESRTQRAHFDCSKAVRVLGWQPTSERAEIIKQGIHVPVAEFLGQRLP